MMFCISFPIDHLPEYWFPMEHVSLTRYRAHLCPIKSQKDIEHWFTSNKSKCLIVWNPLEEVLVIVITNICESQMCWCQLVYKHREKQLAGSPLAASYCLVNHPQQTKVDGSINWYCSVRISTPPSFYIYPHHKGPLFYYYPWDKWGSPPTLLFVSHLLCLNIILFLSPYLLFGWGWLWMFFLVW